MKDEGRRRDARTATAVAVASAIRASARIDGVAPAHTGDGHLPVKRYTGRLAIQKNHDPIAARAAMTVKPAR